MSAIAEARILDGQPAHRLVGSPAGAWITAKSPIDAILDRVQGQLGVNRSTVMCAVGMHHGSLSRCRHGELPMPDEWLLRLCAADKAHRTEGIVPVCNVRCVHYNYGPERGRGPVGEFDSRVTVREWVPIGSVDPWVLPRGFFQGVMA